MSSDLFAGTYARGRAAEAVSGQAWLDAMLEVEAALARACAAEGLIDELAAEAVARACATAKGGGIDLGALAAEAGEHASPVVGLVAELRARVGEPHAQAVHRGATSQDIVDTAAMLILREGVAVACEDARAAARASSQLAERHRDAPQLGRTLLQPAMAISFGRKAAAWAAEIEEAATSLQEQTTELAAVQMGGAVGERPPAVGARVAQLLSLSDPGAPWHTNRVRIARLACALGVLAGALEKVARDVTLLAQGEVGEAREGGPAGRGRSSAMAHKRNPVAAISVLACARRVPGLVATMLAAMEQEHERAAGAWQAEWGTLGELVALTGSAAAWAADLLGNLEVDTERMRANLERLGRRPVKHGSVQLHHERSGPEDGPVVLLGGSLGSSSAMWDPQVAALRSHCSVVAFDHRGHGGSPVPPGPYAIADLGRDVVALMDAMAVERASYVGLSIGGMVGQWLAVNHPERIVRLVLIATSAHLGAPEPWRERAATVRGAGTTEVVADAVLGRWFTPDWAHAHRHRVAELREMIAATPVEGYAGCCEAIAGWDMRAELERIAAPTLVIGGAEDPSTGPEHQRALAAAIPGARLEIVDHAAHLLSIQHPDAVNVLLAEHLGVQR